MKAGLIDMVFLLPVRHPGLGNTSYLVDLGDGSALVVDPERNPNPYLKAAEQHRLVIRHVAETHLHADFVSGALELAKLGASVIAPRSSHHTYSHLRVGNGDRVAMGGLVLRVVATPGHTPEHVSFLLEEESHPRLLFSGGALLAGGVARPDLVSPELTWPLAHQAYQSARRLLTTVPTHVEVWPTHGAGSFCASAGAQPSEAMSIGSERDRHPAMAAPDADTFVAELLAGLESYPTYFRRLREVNRMGPKVLSPSPPRLPLVGSQALAGCTVVDVRPIDRFARGHIPGSVSIALRQQFGTWLGWLLPSDTPLAFVLDPDQDEDELIWQALNVGHEWFIGRIDFADWVASGGEPAALAVVPADRIDPEARVVDVRQKSEWAGGHLADALHIELADLASDPARVGGSVVIHCAHGLRAMTAASLLARAGMGPVAVTTADYSAINGCRRS
ncbi:MAG: MBL fold metallo-hydrolase [Acidimicrobiia bacterium]